MEGFVNATIRMLNRNYLGKNRCDVEFSFNFVPRKNTKKIIFDKIKYLCSNE
jgi:hypothetical protein